MDSENRCLVGNGKFLGSGSMMRLDFHVSLNFVLSCETYGGRTPQDTEACSPRSGRADRDLIVKCFRDVNFLRFTAAGGRMQSALAMGQESSGFSN